MSRRQRMHVPIALSSLIVLVVLGSGLCSCEKKTRDTGAPSEPTPDAEPHLEQAAHESGNEEAAPTTEGSQPSDIDPDAELRRGRRLLQAGDVVEAVAAFERAVEARPKDFVAQNDLAFALLRSERWSDAYNGSAKAVSLAGDARQRAMALYNMARAAEKAELVPDTLHRFEPAQRLYALSLQNRPDEAVFEHLRAFDAYAADEVEKKLLSGPEALWEDSTIFFYPGGWAEQMADHYLDRHSRGHDRQACWIPIWLTAAPNQSICERIIEASSEGGERANYDTDLKCSSKRSATEGQMRAAIVSVDSGPSSTATSYFLTIEDRTGKDHALKLTDVHNPGIGNHHENGGPVQGDDAVTFEQLVPGGAPELRARATRSTFDVDMGIAREYETDAAFEIVCDFPHARPRCFAFVQAARERVTSTAMAEAGRAVVFEQHFKFDVHYRDGRLIADPSARSQEPTGCARRFSGEHDLATLLENRGVSPTTTTARAQN